MEVWPYLEFGNSIIPTYNCLSNFLVKTWKEKIFLLNLWDIYMRICGTLLADLSAVFSASNLWGQPPGRATHQRNRKCLWKNYYYTQNMQLQLLLQFCVITSGWYYLWQMLLVFSHAWVSILLAELLHYKEICLVSL